MMRALIFWMALLSVVPCRAPAQDGEGHDGDRVYVVNDYRYDPGGGDGDADAGHTLCATRCNALSVDYRNYIEPGGWRFIRIASGSELTIPLNNPFLPGNCICTVDEYLVQVNTFNRPKLPAAR